MDFANAVSSDGQKQVQQKTLADCKKHLLIEFKFPCFSFSFSMTTCRNANHKGFASFELVNSEDVKILLLCWVIFCSALFPKARKLLNKIL